MTIHSFQLLPFATLPAEESVAVQGTISCTEHMLHVLFRVSGNPASLKIPEPVANPSRCDGLWQSTCFECFIGRAGSSAYHELNISASGCWNLYHFSDYRTAMEEEAAIAAIASEASRDDSEFILRCALSLHRIVLPADILQIGVCCVLEHHNGEKSYWALSHPGRQPDFHHSDGFGLTLLTNDQMIVP